MRQFNRPEQLICKFSRGTIRYHLRYCKLSLLERCFYLTKCEKKTVCDLLSLPICKIRTGYTLLSIMEMAKKRMI